MRTSSARPSGHWLIAKRRVLNEFIPEGAPIGPNNPCVADMDALAEASKK